MKQAVLAALGFSLVGSAMAQSAAPVRYSVSFPNAVHHEARIEVAMRDLAEGALTVQMSRCLLYTSPSPRDQRGSRMPSSA